MDRGFHLVLPTWLNCERMWLDTRSDSKDKSDGPNSDDLIYLGVSPIVSIVKVFSNFQK